MLEFPEVFWTPDFDYFGAAVDGGPELRGRCFMFWNGAQISGAPILTSIISGKLICFSGAPIHTSIISGKRIRFTGGPILTCIISGKLIRLCCLLSHFDVLEQRPI